MTATVIAVATGCSAEHRDTKVSVPERKWSLESEPFLVLGGEDPAPNEMFTWITDLRLLDDQFLVADSDRTLRIYDLEGQLVTRLGGHGQGPGEFGWISGFWSNGSHIFVLDLSGNSRLNSFTLDGTLVKTVPVPNGFRGGVFAGAFSDNSFVRGSVLSSDVSAEPILVSRAQYARFSPTGQLLDTIAEVAGLWSFLPEHSEGSAGATGLREVHPFSSKPSASVVGDELYITDGLATDIHVLNRSGELLRTIPLPSRTIDPDSAWADLRAELLARGYERQVEGVPPPDTVPYIMAMIPDRSGRLWLKPFVSATDGRWLKPGQRWQEFEGGEWWIMSVESGELEATIDLPDRFRPMDAVGNMLIGVLRSELDVERIVGYQIRR